MRPRFILGLILFTAVSLRADSPPMRGGLGALFSGLGPGEGDALDVEPGRQGVPRILKESYRGAAVVSHSDRDTWLVNGRAEWFDVSDPPVIPTVNLKFPETLYNVQAGGNFSRELGERRGIGAGLSVGSASDRLFNTIHETEIQANIYYELPSHQNNAWFLLAQYSNNRTFLNNVPIPGFAYLWMIPEHHFRAVLGFPFLSISYDPDPWSLRMSLFGPTNQRIELSRRIWGPLKMYASYDHSPQSWLRTNRDNYSNRLIFNEQRGMTGFRCALGPHWSLDLGGGYAFQRRFYESKDANRTDVPKANIPSAPVVSASVSVRF